MKYAKISDNVLVSASKARRSETENRLRMAMEKIEAEISENHGIYPFNRGRLSQAEVCRRADIGDSTLNSDTHRDTTRETLIKWLERVKLDLAQGKKNIARRITQRVDNSEQELSEIKDNYHISRLELLEARRKNRDLERTILKLMEERDALRSQISNERGRNVVDFPSPRTQEET